jgi:hypothetical protein
MVLAFAVAACGRTGLEDDLLIGDASPDASTSSPDAPIPFDSGVPATCGDHTCGAGETCANCSVDCGICAGCGDGTCSAGETCTSCPQDCGVCKTCGDGICKDGETCLTCAPDCGPCPTCGDGQCTAPNETCYTCPADCGKCPSCGDGFCSPTETCASCEADCGPCDFCGDGKCSPPYETCTNCPQDCGMCKLLGCPEELTCAFGCLNFMGNPPMISVSCIANCAADGCPAAQFFFDQVANCLLANIGSCGPSISCLMGMCQSEIAACLGKLTCN